MPKKGRIFIAGFIIGSLLVISVPDISAMDGPDFVELDSLVNIYEPVDFDHAMHVEVASCATCHHHTTGTPTEDARCVKCHEASEEADEVMCAGCHPANRGRAEKAKALMNADLFHNDRTSLKRAYHLSCLECHKEMDGPIGCEDCHSKREGEGR